MTSPAAWSNGNAYERYMGRWSRPVGQSFIAWLDMPIGCSWLDVGCGTGALTETILAEADASRVVGIDPSAAFIEYARDRNTHARASFEVGDAQRLPPRLGDFDVVVSGLVLNFIPEKTAALQQMVAAACSGGTVAAYVWDYADGMQLMRRFWDAAVVLDPDSRRFDEGSKESICNPHALTALFSEGLVDVEVTALVVPTVFRDFEDYWTPFLGGVGSAPAYVSSLDEEPRERLREALKKSLVTAADGSIELTARAWAVKGTRPIS